MKKALYIATTEPGSGKSIIALGLFHMLLGKGAKVGYFRPIIGNANSDNTDNHIDTIRSYFNLDFNPEEAFAFTRNEVTVKRNEGKIDEILDVIINKYKAIEAKNDFVIVEGTDFSNESYAFELDANVLIAKNLGIPALIVGHADDKTLEECIGALHMAYDSFKDKEVEVLGLVANKADKDKLDVLKKALKRNLHKNILIDAIPKIDLLANPTIKEIVQNLNAEVLFGSDFLHNQTSTFVAGAMQLRNFLTHLKDDCFVVMPGDRADLLLATLQANISSNYPKISGIVLTGGLTPEKSVLKLIKGLSAVVPIVSVEEGTFAITNKVGAIKPQIYADNVTKIRASIRAFEKYVDTEALNKRLVDFTPEGITPKMFQYNLQQRAKKHRKHIVLPESNDERILRAVARLQNLDIVDITLLGDKVLIKNLLMRKGIKLNLKKLNIVNPLTSKYYADYVETFYNLRKHKGINHAVAEDLMTDVSYFGTMMVYKGHADGMVSGAAHTTQHTIRPALQFIKTRPDVSVVSSIFFMCLDDRVSVFGDCAINPNPNAEQLAEIAISSAISSKAFGIDPKIAMLSYSSGKSGKGEDVDKVRQATEIVKKLRPDLEIEGPIQYDAAVDKRVGHSKLPDSKVAGQANVLIFPDLNTGNNTYKAVQRETGALAIGPMLQGLNKPINDLSRGCTVEDIFNTVIITAIQAQDL
ncbi:MAG: phosphate acetyltransferase [Flavobacteriaceae bacterium]